MKPYEWALNFTLTVLAAFAVFGLATGLILLTRCLGRGDDFFSECLVLTVLPMITATIGLLPLHGCVFLVAWIVRAVWFPYVPHPTVKTLNKRQGEALRKVLTS